VKLTEKCPLERWDDIINIVVWELDRIGLFGTHSLPCPVASFGSCLAVHT
jgi:hypothetical protein